MWSYHVYTALSRWNSNVKRRFARIILGWVTLREGRPYGTAIGHNGGRARQEMQGTNARKPTIAVYNFFIGTQVKAVEGCIVASSLKTALLMTNGLVRTPWSSELVQQCILVLP
ncbi:hypothetical protein R1flu_004308 [Riccia fluitans]|uniref:Uncharacterized protein n=1 Tax=Riccia fluitans TaxID=41844 RepID=A0ABD1YSV8_9MARC